MPQPGQSLLAMEGAGPVGHGEMEECVVKEVWSEHVPETGREVSVSSEQQTLR